jgi:hypothetical protein
MTALLALIPSRVYEYGAIILALSLAFGGYTLHERNLQHAKDIAAAAKVVTKDNAIVAADDSHAQTSETQSALIFKQVVSIPAVADIGVVCQRTAPGSVSLPKADAVATTAVGDNAPERGVGPTFDPTGALLTRAALADAEIGYLQRRVAELEKQMNDAP